MLIFIITKYKLNLNEASSLINDIFKINYELDILTLIEINDKI